jgi:hypothetical protein
VNGTRGILILLAGIGLLVAGITIPRPCLGQIRYYPTPETVGFIYSPLPDPNYHIYNQPIPAPRAYYVMAPAPKPCKHGYKHGWKEYPHGKHKPKIKHKNNHKHQCYYD